MRILVVEDEDSVLDPLELLLNKEGFTVVTAKTGKEALEKFDNAGADLILLDLMIPEVSGTEVCRQIRSKSQVPIIMLTAKDTEVDKVVGLELGADLVVTPGVSVCCRLDAGLLENLDGDNVTGLEGLLVCREWPELRFLVQALGLSHGRQQHCDAD